MKKNFFPPSAERDRIEREIAVTDEKIDDIVYELYGITELVGWAAPTKRDLKIAGIAHPARLSEFIEIIEKTEVLV